MPTPTRRSNAGYTGPSSSFLHQLLNEISGRHTPTVLQKKDTSHGAPTSQSSSHGSGRRSSSVWVGGSLIAQGARAKLRAADEARPHKPSTYGTDGLPDGYGPSSRLLTLRSRADTSTSARSVKSAGHGESNVPDQALQGTGHCDARAMTTSSEAMPRGQPTLGSLRIPSSTFYTQSLWFADDVARAESPLMFNDSGSDITLTPSPTEAPSSAVTVSSATTVSDNHAPRKRVYSPQDLSDMSPKKVRTTTLPETGSPTRSGTSSPSALRGIGDTRITRGPAFIERTSAPRGSTSPREQGTLPAVSSFRPEETSPQGVVPATPVRTSPRRSNIYEASPSPVLADTPSYARPLHLIDGEVSVYKQAHGEAWKENSLCLYCFSRHGKFNRVFTDGYELCGREEVLDSHYWESALDP